MMPSMRRLTFLFLPAALLLAAACGGDDDGSDDSGNPTRPPSSGDVPTATSEQVEDLANVPVPGYSAEGRGDTVLGAAVTHLAAAKTAGGADLMVRVNIAACDDFVCRDPAEYQTPDVQESLKSVLPATHKENPALRWEFGEVQLSNTANGLYYYALSYVETKTSDGGTSRASANSYRAWYHNGGAYVTLEVFSRSPISPLSLADLEKTMTKAEAEKAAREVFAALEPKLPR